MNNINLIKEDFAVGDCIRISCSLGTKEGIIISFWENRLKIQPFDKSKKPISVMDTTITDWEEAVIPEKTQGQIGEQHAGCDVETKNKINSESSAEVGPLLDNSEKIIEQTQTLSTLEISTECEQPIETPSKEYKVGDVIPMDVLLKIDPKLKQKQRIPSTEKKKKEKLRTIGTDFSALYSMVRDSHEAENKSFIPALGEVKFVKPELNFGFIRDAKSGKDLYFSLNEIVDPILISSILPHASVVYSIIEAERGTKAMAIHKAKTIEELLDLADTLCKNGDYKHAIMVLDHILAEYPQNFSADRLKTEIKKEHPECKIKVKEYSSAYAQAKKYHVNKNFDKAIEYYKIALENGEKVESSIKDLGMLYAQLYKSADGEEEKEKYRTTAINFMDEYEEDLNYNVSSLYYLENFYYSVRDFDSFMDVVDKLVDEPDVFKYKTKHADLLTKKAAAFLQINQIEKALDTIEDALSIDPNNIAAVKLRTIIETNPNTEDLSKAISATEFETLNSGLSSYIQHILDSYDEFAGVPAKIIESGNFDDKTLKGIRTVIDSVQGRASERAKYLLTESKLISILEPYNMVKLRSTLARYCNDMAKIHIWNNSRSDIVRFYYNEAFSLENRYDATARQISYYLLTYCYGFEELFNATSSDISIDFALSKVLTEPFDPKVWEGVLSMFMSNSQISAQITAKLFQNSQYKHLALQALSLYGINVTKNVSKENFINYWNKAREIRTNDCKKASTSIKMIGEVKNIDELTEALPKLIDIKQDWMNSLDISRIHNVINNIVPALDTYRKVSGYRNKEIYKNNTNGLIQQIIDEINDGPTKLSFEAILPLMERAQSLLSESFGNVIKMSEPRLEMELLSAETVVNPDQTVSIQIAVSNHRDSSPIREVLVTIEDSNDIKLINNGDTTAYNAIEGGEELIFKLKVKVGEDVIKKRATVLTAICHYKNGNVEKLYSKLLSLRLYSSDEFRPIENPYAPVADGGPVPINSKMFFGREDFINNIVEAILNAQSKQVIIYGQKRCGKSSVLVHLKKQLQDTGSTFCVSFSLGEIISNLSEYSFYYKILNSIQTEIDLMKIKDESIVPDIKFPKFSEFKAEDEENPLNTFIKYLIIFKIACGKTTGWEHKKLVVLIDEFTYLYSGIKHGNVSNTIMKQWKAVTQNELAQFSVVLVGQDVVPSFKKEDYASNAFGVIQDIRLTYLNDEPARELIETPILNENGESRYIGNAVSKIIEWTSRNPYYIQIFCSRLVDYMNKNKSICVTEADVNDVAKTFVRGSDALPEDKFDNLIRAGESEDLQEFPERDILAILRQIALNSKNIGYCKREDVRVLQNIEEENAIFKHLYDREVLEKKGEDNYKIQVKLFQEWLLNH